MKHIVILKSKYFNMIVNGEKTIESRFSMNKSAPYNKVNVNDTLLIKQTGKDVTHTAVVTKVEYFELTPQLVENIRVKYGKQIGSTDKTEWQTTYLKKYCTLVWLNNVTPITPLKVPRSCGAGWIIVK